MRKSLADSRSSALDGRFESAEKEEVIHASLDICGPTRWDSFQCWLVGRTFGARQVSFPNHLTCTDVLDATYSPLTDSR